MNKLMMIAAAAATTLFVPAVSAPAIANPAVSATAQVNEYDHIRTTLHGTKGPLIVLIPGMSTPGAVWDDTVAAMKAGNRLLVVEVKGFDGAPNAANEAPGLINGIVADLSGDLTARHFRKATIVGHSFGGLLAMKFALDRPKQTDRIMIVDALPFFGTVFDDKATVESTEPRAAAMRTQLLASREAMKAMAAKGVTSDPGGGMASTPESRIKISNWSLKADAAVVAQALYEDMQMDLRKDIAAIRAPVVVLYQAQDPVASAARYGTDYAALPAAKLIPVAETSHFIMLDQPRLFRKELGTFVNSQDK